MFKGKWKWYMMLAVLLALIFLNRELSQSVVSEDVSENEIVIIDAGHGGKDPGKIGVNDVLEKDLNLQIAKKVKENLEKQKVTVIMTREDDTAEDGKMADMKKRVEIGNNSNADIFVSVHLNKIPQNQYWGWQTFFRKNDEASTKLEKSIQNGLNQAIQKENKREALKIEDKYIVKNVKIPITIVECGFLSNEEEERLLQTDEYQDKLAWGIYSGIMDYFM